MRTYQCIRLADNSVQLGTKRYSPWTRCSNSTAVVGVWIFWWIVGRRQNVVIRCRTNVELIVQHVIAICQPTSVLFVNENYMLLPSYRHLTCLTILEYFSRYTLQDNGAAPTVLARQVFLSAGSKFNYILRHKKIRDSASWYFTMSSF